MSRTEQAGIKSLRNRPLSGMRVLGPAARQEMGGEPSEKRQQDEPSGPPTLPLRRDRKSLPHVFGQGVAWGAVE